MREILRDVNIIHYLVKRLKEKYPHKQIGKTIIQRLMYLFENQTNRDLRFTMYHYGVHSSFVGDCINLAEALGLIAVRWDYKRGYLISACERKLGENEALPSSDREIMDKLIDRYGAVSNAELFAITSALYILNNFEITNFSDLIRGIYSLKPAIILGKEK